MFSYSTQIFLHHTDAAGRLFFARQFDLICEAKEKFLEEIELPIQDILDHPRITFPLIHAESDYKALLRSGDRIVIQVAIEKLGNTSVVFSFTIMKLNGVLAGTAKTVNVCVDKTTGEKCPIPEEWRVKFADRMN